MARCVAALCSHATSAQRQALLTRLLTPSNDVDGAERHLQLLCVGEIGRLHDVYATHRGCFDTLYDSFTSSNEAIKSAAAFALGTSVCVCPVGVVLIAATSGRPTSCACSVPLSGRRCVRGMPGAWPGHAAGASAEAGLARLPAPLLDEGGAVSARGFAGRVPPPRGPCRGGTGRALREQGGGCSQHGCRVPRYVRRVDGCCVHACVPDTLLRRVRLPGKLVAIDAATMVPRFRALVASTSPNARWTVVTAVKYAAAYASARTALAPVRAVRGRWCAARGCNNEFQRAWRVQHVSTFLECLQDTDLEVRRAALLSLNALVHHDVSLVRPLLASTAEGEAKASEPPVRSTHVLAPPPPGSWPAG